MKTNTCRIASNDSVILNEDVRIEMHRQCPAAYINEDTGGMEYCDCECHSDGRGRTRKDPDPEALPVLSSAVSAPRPEALRVDRPVPPRTRGGGSSCECGCGRPTGGKFAPGHDAKLKSRLVNEALRGSDLAVVEIVYRNWTATARGLPQDRYDKAEEILEKEGTGAVIRRIEERRRMNTVST